MSKDLILVGAGGLGREVAWIVERINEKNEEWNLIGFLDDDPDLNGKSLNGYRVIGEITDAKKYPDAWYLCTLGFSSVRESVVQRLGNVKFATIIDPSAIVSDTVPIGEGTCIGANTVVEVNACIGKQVLIRALDVIGHDSIISDFVTISPGAVVGGFAEIEECSEVGMGTNIIPTKKIGKSSVIGAGAVVIKNIPDQCTAVGSPAEPIKYHK